MAEGDLEAGEIEDAFQGATDALTLFRESDGEAGISWGVADALRLLVHCHCQMGQAHAALELASAELATFAGAGDATGAAKMQLACAEALVHLPDGDLRGSEALEAVGNALASFRQAVDARGEANAHLVASSVRLRATCGGRRASEVQLALEEACKARGSFEALRDPRNAAKAMHNMAVAYMAMHEFEDALDLGNKALAAFGAAKDHLWQAVELHCLGVWSLQSDRPTEAVSFAEKALAAFRDFNGRVAWEGMAMSVLVRAHGECWEVREALSVAKRGLRRFQDLDDNEAEGYAFEALVYVHMLLGDAAEAVQSARKAAKAFQYAGLAASKVRAAWQLAELLTSSGRADEAAASIKAILQDRELAGSARGQGQAWLRFGRVQLAARLYDSALAAAEDAEARFAEAGDGHGKADALMLAALVHAGKLRWDSAGTCAAKAMVYFEEAGELDALAQTLRTLCEIQVERKALHQALRAAEKSAQLLEETRDRRGHAGALVLEAETRLKLLESEPSADGILEALRGSGEAASLARELESAELLGKALLVLGKALQVDGRAQEAILHLTEAAGYFKDIGNSYGEAQAMLAQAAALMAANRVEEAVRLAKQARDYVDEGKVTNRSEAEHIMAMYTKLRPMVQSMIAGPPLALAEKPAPPPAQPAEAVAERSGPIVVRDYSGIDLSGKVAKEMVELRLLQIMDELLGIPDIESDTPLMQAGVSSAASVVLQKAMQQDFPTVDLPATLVFDYPSPSEIAGYISGSIADAAA